MIVYFSTNQSIWSKMLRWVFSEPTSHVGVGFDDLGIGIELVADCTKPHGKLMALENWKKKYEILASMRINLDEKDKKTMFLGISTNCINKRYDYDAYVYGFYWGLLIKFFKMTPPRKNKKSSYDEELCTEILNPVKISLLKYGVNLLGIDCAAMTPGMLCGELYRQTALNANIDWNFESLEVIAYLENYIRQR